MKDLHVSMIFDLIVIMLCFCRDILGTLGALHFERYAGIPSTWGIFSIRYFSFSIYLPVISYCI